MKKTIINSFLILGCVPLFGQIYNDVADSGNDEYIGGSPTDSNFDGVDVVGNATSPFDLKTWNVSVDFNPITGDTMMGVQITGDYFESIIANDQAGAGDLLDTTMGDLFISTTGLGWGSGDDTNKDWNAATNRTAPTTTTDWDYAIEVTKRGGPFESSEVGRSNAFTTSGYDASDNANIVESNVTSGDFREWQEWKLDTTNLDKKFNANWWIEEESINFTFNVADLGDLGDAIGFHFTMSCANDVIEFEIPIDTIPQGVVPEPSTYAAFGLGTLLSLVYLRRRRAQKKA